MVNITKHSAKYTFILVPVAVTVLFLTLLWKKLKRDKVAVKVSSYQYRYRGDKYIW